MAIRWTAGDSKGVPSGYSGPVAEQYDIPACSIEDTDRALYQMFNEQLDFVVSNKQSGKVQKAHVVFAAGERWAMLKKGTLLRDKEGSLILPLVSIARTGIEQADAGDISGRGTNQQTGDLVLRRQLSNEDRKYQELINKLGIVDQLNVGSSHASGSQTTRWDSKQNERDPDVVDGGLLSPKLKNNVWEFLIIPAPQFYTATYEIVFWTQYIDHMNQMLSKLMSAYLPQGNALKLETPHGYWFIATVEGNSFSADINADDMSESERIIKYKFTVKVRSYLVASRSPGVPPAVRKYISAPVVQFSMGLDDESSTKAGSADPFDGADDPTNGFSLHGDVIRSPDHKQLPVFQKRTWKNPFTGKERTQFVRVVTKNPGSGETVYNVDDMDMGTFVKLLE